MKLDSNYAVHVKAFEQLSNSELYQIVVARIAVFVVEQNCAYQEIDHKDPLCEHLMLRSESAALLGYTRIVPPGLSFAEHSIGRVLTTAAGRGKNLGRSLMLASMERCQQLGATSIQIGAQAHLERFYSSLGFTRNSDQYLEDGIPHFDMIWHQSLSDS